MYIWIIYACKVCALSQAQELQLQHNIQQSTPYSNVFLHPVTAHLHSMQTLQHQIPEETQQPASPGGVCCGW